MRKVYPGILLMCIVFSINSFSQGPGLRTWDFFYGKYNFNKNWFAFLEPHVTTEHAVHDFNYYEYNLGIGRSLSKSVSISGAIGQYKTFQNEGFFEKPLLADEFRIWEQLSYTTYLSRLKIEQRYRLEQRFISTGYRNRLRSRLALTLPLNHSTLAPHTFYTATSNEFFLTNEAPFFDQNWLFLGIGYQVNAHVGFHVGWLNRLNQSAAYVVTWRNYLQTALFFSVH
jgi:hypothetical protein